MQGSTRGSGIHGIEVSELGYAPPLVSQPPGGHPSNGIDAGLTAQNNIASGLRPGGAQPRDTRSPSPLKNRPGTGNRLFIPKDNIGFLYGNEFRHPATFNYSRIMWYLELVDDVIRALDTSVPVAGQVGGPGNVR